MKLIYCLAVSSFTLGLMAGCDDDRNLGDLGPGEELGGSGSLAGAPATNGGSDAAAGQSGGGGESGDGAGGASATECPTDFLEADGEPCSQEGQICSDGADDPCGFGNSLLCSGGEWQHQEAFPGPCGGAGAGGVSAGGAGGAEAGGAGGGQ